jgi:hypothetical protein
MIFRRSALETGRNFIRLKRPIKNGKKLSMR